MKNQLFHPVHPLGQDIGQQIKEARKKANMSQVEVAEKLSTTRQTIIAIEKGENVGIHLVLSLAKTLGLSCFVIK